MALYYENYSVFINVAITTIKILCDGLGISLGEFFNLSEFDYLEQESE
ncbi:MAG: hypothetical protein K2O36_06150 [Ruminococcus sp.]|nr:hypothetical protein [Ruminococcus sp.]